MSHSASLCLPRATYPSPQNRSLPFPTCPPDAVRFSTCPSHLTPSSTCSPVSTLPHLPCSNPFPSSPSHLTFPVHLLTCFHFTSSALQYNWLNSTHSLPDSKFKVVPLCLCFQTPLEPELYPDSDPVPEPPCLPVSVPVSLYIPSLWQ